MTDIFLTNDDGYRSAGFVPMLSELSTLGTVTALAPNRERSWIGKGITTKKELRIQPRRRNGFDLLTLNGTPADCVQIGIHNVLAKKPDLVISGINLGENVGHARILSSGTVGAAMEASFYGIPAIASSLSIPRELKKTTNLFHVKNYCLFRNAAKITSKLAGILLKNTFECVDLFCVNIPFDATVDTKISVTKPFQDPYGPLFHQHGSGFIHHVPSFEEKNLHEGTDYNAVCEGNISVTPINLALVSDHSLSFASCILKKEW
ncbi:MAG: 5'/3'-nucleotidase SurE [Euryarchaeota archaeon]|nr:5'/3'-nucleotidase SurE [Euryarchaeota archaeon]